MTTTKTISVEPAKITLADRKNKELASDLFRTNIINRNKTQVNVLNLVFPTQLSGNLAYNKYSIPLRSVFSAILIVAGITMLQNNMLLSGGVTATGILAIVFGSFLALGLFSRIAMAASSVMFLTMGIIALRNGFNDITAFSLMFGSVMFFFLGSGKYSCDTLIKKEIRRRQVEKRRKMQDERLSFKAFSYMTKNM